MGYRHGQEISSALGIPSSIPALGQVLGTDRDTIDKGYNLLGRVWPAVSTC